MDDHTLAVQVPADDGSIQRAFQELDARLAAWFSAMKDAQHAVSEQTHLPAPQETATTATPDPVAPEALSSVPSPSASSTPVAEAKAGIPDAALAVAPAPPATGKPKAAAPSPSPPPAQSVAEPPVAPVAADAGAGPRSETTEPTPPAEKRRRKGIVAMAPPSAAREVNEQTVDDEERTLLESLDEETATAIKVMRRLNPSNKTLRQLLEEYEASKTTRSAEARDRKSWWKKGK